MFDGVEYRLHRILDREHEHLIGGEQVVDAGSGIVYNRYGAGLIDRETGIALRPPDGGPEGYPDAVSVAGMSLQSIGE